MDENFRAALQRETGHAGGVIARGLEQVPMRAWRAWGEGAMPVNPAQSRRWRALLRKRNAQP
jgi:hypothetical protein